MKLSDMDIKEFNDTLASDTPAPGGGSASALMGALGSGLSAMVVRLSKEEGSHSERIKRIMENLDSIREELIDAIDSDTEAFMLVSKAFSMPKNTDEEKSERSKAIQAGLLECTESPLNMMIIMNKAADLTLELSEKYNTNAASDLGVAALSIEAGARGAYFNVLINLGSLKDKEKVAEYREKAESIIAEITEKTGKVKSAVEKAIS